MHIPTVKWLLDHGSNRNTTIRSHRDKEQSNDYTMLELVSGIRGIEHGRRPIGNHLVNSTQPIDLLGPWVDEISFHADGTGWDLIISLLGSSSERLGLRALTPAVAWVLQTHGPEIRKSIETSPRRLQDMLHRALWAGRPDLVDLIWAELGAQVNVSDFSGFGALHRLVARLTGEVLDEQIPGISAAVGKLLEKRYSPHDLGHEDLYSNEGETPLSIAMHSSGAFWHWRNILQNIGIDLETYTAREIQQKSRLTDSGWRKEDLIVLFRFPFSSSFYNERSTCRRCKKCFYFSWETWWQEVLRNSRENSMEHLGTADQTRIWRPFHQWNDLVQDDYFKGWVQVVKTENTTLGTHSGERLQEHVEDPRVWQVGRPIILSTEDTVTLSATLLPTPDDDCDENSATSETNTREQQDAKTSIGDSKEEKVKAMWSYRRDEEQLCKGCRLVILK